MKGRAQAEKGMDLAPLYAEDEDTMAADIAQEEGEAQPDGEAMEDVDGEPEPGLVVPLIPWAKSEAL
eukprot:8296182-Lingulodinium_polyedra.AAC.1